MSLFRIVKTKQQRRESGLAGATRTDEGDAFARTRGQGDLPQHGDFRTRGIAETDRLEGHLAPQACGQQGDHGGAGRGECFGGFAQQFTHALSRADGFLNLAEQLRGLAHGTCDKRGVEHKPGQFPFRDGSALQLGRAKPEHDHDATEEGEDEECDEDRAPPGGAERGREDTRVGAIVPAELERFVGEGLDAGDRLQRFLDDGLGGRQLVLGFPRIASQPASEKHRCGDQQRQGAEHHRGQAARGQGDQGDASGEKHRLPAELGQGVDQGAFDLGDIGRNPAGQFAHPTMPKEGHRQRDQPAVTIASQIGQRALSHPVEREGAVERGQGLQTDRDGEQQGDLIERDTSKPGQRGGTCVQGGIDQRARKKGKQQSQRRAEEQRDQSGDETRAERTQVAGERECLPHALPGQRGLGQALEGDVFLGRGTAGHGGRPSPRSGKMTSGAVAGFLRPSIVPRFRVSASSTRLESGRLVEPDRKTPGRSHSRPPAALRCSG